MALESHFKKKIWSQEHGPWWLRHLSSTLGYPFWASGMSLILSSVHCSSPYEKELWTHPCSQTLCAVCWVGMSLQPLRRQEGSRESCSHCLPGYLRIHQVRWESSVYHHPAQPCKMAQRGLETTADCSHCRNKQPGTNLKWHVGLSGGLGIKRPSKGSVVRGKVNHGIMGSSHPEATFKLEEQTDNSPGDL